MNEPEVVIHLDGDRRVYWPGDVLSGEFHCESLSLADPQSVELSVMWYTDGQGDEDLGVHYFQRFARDDESAIDFRRPQRFSTVLPNSPLSYDGVLIHLFWCVRVRMFLARGKEGVAEQLFRLGHVPQVSLAALEEPLP
ncbi:MAG TPA: hypothetical protein VG713_02770 [Pirellulales bacterium]|nr:hypothetical protein [Pirellulales bacterium]